MKEKFAIPCIGAIIEKEIDGERYILIQERQKDEDIEANGLLEFVGGKLREYENIFDCIRREVLEETGLVVTKIQGEEKSFYNIVDGNRVMSFEPFCISQNLSGVYSIIQNVFICHTEGEPVKSTDETINIRFEKIETIKQMITENKDQFFLMDINPLKKYLKLFN